MQREVPFHWAWIILATCFVNLFIKKNLAYQRELFYAGFCFVLLVCMSLNRCGDGVGERVVRGALAPRIKSYLISIDTRSWNLVSMFCLNSSTHLLP